jgi:ubiquitin carboxyl-terminal hydrolase 9/24
MRRLVCGLIQTALRALYPLEAKEEKNLLFETDAKGFPTTLSANFINSCIQCIGDIRRSGRDYTDFFKVFHIFSQLGPETAQYLIEKRIIGRLLEDFYETSDALKNLGDVNYREPEEHFMGLPHQEKNKVRTALDEFLQRRKEKYLMESYSASRMYMWQTIAALLPYCRLRKSLPRCPWQIGNFDCELKREELLLLQTADTKMILSILENANNKVAIRSVAFILGYLCYEDERISLAVLGTCTKAIKDKQVKDFRCFFACIKKVLLLSDSLQKKRVSIKPNEALQYSF